MNDKLHDILERLRLNGMADTLDQQIEKAENEGTPVSEVL